jgi:hypothetical protein
MTNESGDKHRDDFFLRVAQALSGCQLVEQELKLYITEALELVTKCLDGKLAFRMKGDDYADSSLEKLIGTFRKLSNEPQLVIELETFKTKRNELSHRAISSCLDPDDELDWQLSAQMTNTLTEIEQEAQRLRAAIHLAGNKFRAALYFDPIPDEA